MAKRDYVGLLCIGDPHLASRVPGFRQDDYPRVVLGKLRWCIEYAQSNRLLPCILGDLFHWPRDNANWLLRAALEILCCEVIGIAGNHDCGENQLSEDDSLSVLEAAGCLQLVDRSGPWRGTMFDRNVIVGGTSWGAKIPTEAPRDLLPRDRVHSGAEPLVFWLTHCDIMFPGYEETGWLKPQPLYGIDVVINGHIHGPLPDVVTGDTTWLNPGNITRIKRSDSTRERTPSALRIDIVTDEACPAGWRKSLVPVPHAPFDDVFHAEVVSETVPSSSSAFVSGLAELIARRTETGAGLHEYLARNLSQFDPRVAQEIQLLAKEVLEDGFEQDIVAAR